MVRDTINDTVLLILLTYWQISKNAINIDV